MISAMKVTFATLLVSLIVFSSAAFAPRTTFQAARVIPGNTCAVKKHKTNFLLHMSDPEKSTEEQKSAVTPTSGTYYDDEVSVVSFRLFKFRTLVSFL